MTVDFSLALIYKICRKDGDETNIYVGSTCDLHHRLSCHKSDCTNEKRKSYNFKVYKHIRENGGWEAWKSVLIEFYPCDTTDEIKNKTTKSHKNYL